MPHLISTEVVTLNLDKYLKENNYFDGKDLEENSQQILVSWEKQFRQAIGEDLMQRFADVDVHFLSSQFALASDDSHSACEFLQEGIISDKATTEFLKVSFKTLINYNTTTVYLDSRYADRVSWEGESKTLKVIFDKLKLADQLAGYFNPITLKSLVTP
jgi:hypothetical protein